MARKSKLPTYGEITEAASVIRNDKFQKLVVDAIVRELNGRTLNVVGWSFDGLKTIKVVALDGGVPTYLYIDLDCVYDVNYHRAKINHSCRAHNLRKQCEHYNRMINEKSREIRDYKTKIAEISDECMRINQEIEESRTIKLA